MAQWKIGYPSGLSLVANEEAGRALYAGWSIVPITLSSLQPLHAIYAASAVTSESISGSGANHTTNDVKGGMLKVNSGAGKGFMAPISSNTSTTFSTTGVSPYRPTTDGGVAVGNVFEVVTGECCYTFPVGRNPKRHDYKFAIKQASERMPYAVGGYQLPLGREPDSFNLQATFANLAQFNQLMILLSNPIGYDGKHAMLGSRNTAPMILEQGQAHEDHQYLVNYKGCEVDRDSHRGKAISVIFEFEHIETPSFRGI